MALENRIESGKEEEEGGIKKLNFQNSDEAKDQ